MMLAQRCPTFWEVTEWSIYYRLFIMRVRLEASSGDLWRKVETK